MGCPRGHDDRDRTAARRGRGLRVVRRKRFAAPGIAEFLGDLRGKRVIEYGCGLGKLTVLLARSGAQVTAFDLSEGSVEVARKRAA